MNNRISFGYEKEKGGIQYVLFDDLSFEKISIFLEKREIPPNYNNINECNNIIDYFSEEKFNIENSSWRIAYMLDGTSKIKRNNSRGEYIYNSLE